MQIIGMNHAQITIPVGTEDTARKFYCDLLGLNEIAKPQSLAGRGGFWLLAGDFPVHVGVEDGVERSKTKVHLAYAVVGLEAWRQVLVSAEIVLETQPPLPGYNRFLFRDPFGNRVEFLESTA